MSKKRDRTPHNAAAVRDRIAAAKTEHALDELEKRNAAVDAIRAAREAGLPPFPTTDLSARVRELEDILRIITDHACEMYPHFESERGQKEIAIARAALARK